MGVDLHGLNFLRYAKTKQPLGSVITIGRQGLHVIEPLVKEIFQTGASYKNQTYCEELLTKYMGATGVESVDHSNFEGASHVHDMNQPLPSDLAGRFDTVFDGGCLEHIYNAPQALKNCSLLCKPGGQISHVLPGNNFCGHGFWQFSPELFFSLYSEGNGYADTQVFMADLYNTRQWYQVKKPANGVRVNVMSSNPLYVMVRTVRVGTEFSHDHVQQSDYEFEWNGSNNHHLTEPQNESAVKRQLKKILLIYRLMSPIYHFYLKLKNSEGLNRKNPGLSLVSVKNLIAPTSRA